MVSFAALGAEVPSFAEHFVTIPPAMVTCAVPLPMEALGVFEYAFNVLYAQALGTDTWGSFLLSVLVRDRLRQFALACIALGSVFVTQVIFWMFTFPVNQQTRNWTTLPVNWMTLRERWEYSHLTAAVFDLIAFTAVVLAVLAAVGHREDTPPARRAAPGESPINRLNARLNAASDS